MHNVEKVTHKINNKEHFYVKMGPSLRSQAHKVVKKRRSVVNGKIWPKTLP